MQGKDAIIVSDLDSLATHELVFKLHGKKFTILPVSQRVFLQFVEGLAQLYKSYGELGQGKDREEIENFSRDCQALINTVVPGITREDIENCTSAQITALFSIIIDHVKGSSSIKYPDDIAQKKKITH